MTTTQSKALSEHNGRRSVLIVDDETVILGQLAKELKRNFFKVLTAASGKEALEIFSKEAPDMILLDVNLPDIDGLEVLGRVKKTRPDCEVIVVTGYGTQDVAVQALRRGAIDYIEKPVNLEDLRAALGRAEERLAKKEQLEYQDAILIVDDEKNVAARLSRVLIKEKYRVFEAYQGAEALELIRKNKIDVVIADIKLGEMDGVEVLRKAKELQPDIEVIIVTGYGDQDLAVECLREGAIDYLQKPINIDELLWTVEKAVEKIRLLRNALYRNRELKLSSEIVSRVNEGLEKAVEERTQKLSQAQAQLFQTAKLATLGEMSAGLAHEINQPLAGISLVAKSFRKLIERDELTPDEINSGLGEIEISVKRMSKVISYIRTFARQDTLDFVKMDINETIESALNLLREQLRLHEITVDLDLAADLPAITGEPYQLAEVWINIIVNARDALDMKETDGEKTLRIASVHDPKSRCILITFSDNGIGMNLEQTKKIFEPFFTTKEVGKATGLGMSISYGIIESHNGRIEAQSSVQGATLRVTLPVTSL